MSRRSDLRMLMASFGSSAARSLIFDKNVWVRRKEPRYEADEWRRRALAEEARAQRVDIVAMDLQAEVWRQAGVIAGLEVRWWCRVQKLKAKVAELQDEIDRLKGGVA